MLPTLCPGSTLYVHPQASDIGPGDIIVFGTGQGDRLVAHRVVASQAHGWLTRGDNNRRNDVVLVGFDQVVGRVEIQQFGSLRRRVLGGRSGLLLARTRWLARAVFVGLHDLLGRPYDALRRSVVLQRMLGRAISPYLDVLRLETPDGPLVITTLRGKTVARWWPRLGRFECGKPYDLIIPLPEGARRA